MRFQWRFNRQIDEALDLAAKLCTMEHAHESADDVQRRLGDVLHLEQGVPVCVGRSSLWHKMHALLHSERMTSATWRIAARLVNSTFSIVGDLGEKNIVSFRSNLSQMFGRWVRDDDDYELKVPKDGILLVDKMAQLVSET